jgi:hypothetical protein
MGNKLLPPKPCDATKPLLHIFKGVDLEILCRGHELFHYDCTDLSKEDVEARALYAHFHTAFLFFEYFPDGNQGDSDFLLYQTFLVYLKKYQKRYKQAPMGIPS